MDDTLLHQIGAFQQACRSQNLRVTPQRLEIFSELARAADHPTVEKLHQRLLQRMPTLSLDTVYRTLGTFVELGLVNKVETVEKQAHFEVSLRQHHHLICEKCGVIIDFDWPLIDQVDLPEEARKAGHFERKSLIAYGKCRHCL